MKLFLGIDGGQSHTSALVADSRGRILGSGSAGASNHTREPGGRERLITALTRSVGEALAQAGLRKGAGGCVFSSAYLGMTGAPEDKVDIVRELLRADHLFVGHDAPAALAGALAGDAGVIVLAGTGAVACGVTRDGRYARMGGHGYMFGDAGSAFAIAREALAGELAREDTGSESELKEALLAHFKRPTLKSIAEDFYAGELSRDRLASFAARAGRLARRGAGPARRLIDDAALELAGIAIRTVNRLELTDNPLRISYGGGVFRNRRLLERFTAVIKAELPQTRISAPRFAPDIGALLLAYRQAGRQITARLLENISATKR